MAVTTVVVQRSGLAVSHSDQFSVVLVTFTEVLVEEAGSQLAQVAGSVDLAGVLVLVDDHSDQVAGSSFLTVVVVDLAGAEAQLSQPSAATRPATALIATIENFILIGFVGLN